MVLVDGDRLRREHMVVLVNNFIFECWGNHNVKSLVFSWELNKNGAHKIHFGFIAKKITFSNSIKEI